MYARKQNSNQRQKKQHYENDIWYTNSYKSARGGWRTPTNDHTKLKLDRLKWLACKVEVEAKSARPLPHPLIHIW